MVERSLGVRETPGSIPGSPIRRHDFLPAPLRAAIRLFLAPALRAAKPLAQYAALRRGCDYHAPFRFTARRQVCFRFLTFGAQRFWGSLSLTRKIQLGSGFTAV